LGEKLREREREENWREREKEEKWYCGVKKNVYVAFKKSTLLQY